MTLLAIQNTVLARRTRGSEGLLVRSLWSYLAPRKVMNGVRLTAGQVCKLGLAHNVMTMTENRSFKAPRWRRWATTVGEVNKVDVPAMVRAVGSANKGHAQQALDTIVDPLEADDDESVQVDGSVPPSFGEWRLKGVKKVWFAIMAPTDRQDVAVWPALWKTNLPTITDEFIYRVPWKKLHVRQRVKLVKDTEDTCVCCGSQETVYHFVKSCPMVRLLYAVCRDVATPLMAGTDVGRWVSDDPIIAPTNPTGLCVWWGLH